MPEPPDRPAGRGYRGTAKREQPIRHDTGLGPWRGEVKVVPVRLSAGVVFEVVASWHGPPAPGFMPSRDPVDATDVYATERADLARAIALDAAAALRAPRVPDLREIARDLKRRLAAGAYG